MLPETTIPAIEYDGTLQLATGRSRKETSWKNKELSWYDLLAKLSTTTRTRETYARYLKMNKTDQGAIKDIGGFVGGYLKSGRRKSGQVAWRSMLTLDADFAPADLWDTIEILFGNAACMYTTHSHSPEKPRYRLIAPLARKVTPDEYKALSRFIAAEIGIDIFDDSTYEPERLMYWPSTAEDGEYLFKYQDGPWLDPDEALARHPEWQDATTWPESSRAGRARQKHAEKQGDPREKPGVVGAFCRAYTVPEAIEAFLPDIYLPCDTPGRYTYTGGTTAAGLVIYDGDLFAFSHHGTDPTGGILCNAFDLVRIHKYGVKDEDSMPDTPVHKLPSYTEMTRWALTDEGVRIELATTRAQEAQDDFGEELPQDNAWRAKLAYNEKGGIAQTIHNAVLILRHDTRLQSVLGYDEFTRRQICNGSTPWKKEKGVRAWTDTDDAALRHYIERTYGLKGRDTIQDAVAIVMAENAYHPVREYLDSITWDGTARIDTVLIDLLGAEDTIYTRAVSRKWMTAAVARVRDPGCKFDHMLILIGDQGIGKSQFLSRLAKRPAWFSDSMSRFDNSKESMEHLAGKWIIEMGELSSMKKAEVEYIKTFLTKQEDSYRPSYGRRLETFPRQCVFAGTTNRDDFLQDATGNRRFWPVPVTDATRMWAELTPERIDQLWAEADMAYTLGEALYLDGEAAIMAAEAQDRFMELGGKIGMAGEFLERKLPEDWAKKNIKDKIAWLKGFDFDEEMEGTMERTAISGVELYVECFNGKPEEYRKADAYEMTDILTKLGWKRGGDRVRIPEYGRQRVFTRPGQA